jgi:hypothetical protein
VTDTARIPGTNTGHGHVWRRPDGMVARCGGQRMCRQCREDAEILRIHEDMRQNMTEAGVRADERRRVAAYLDRVAGQINLTSGPTVAAVDALRQAAGWCRDDRLWAGGDVGHEPLG